MAGYNLGTASGRIIVEGSGAKAGFAVAQAAAESFYSVLQEKLSSIENFGENLMKASAVGAVGFGIAGNAAANFEQRLSAVRAVSGATEDQMAAISEEALRIGANTAFSATEAASAFEELVKAGISVEDALDGAAQATADLAAAGEISLPRAAEIAATAMNNFKLQGKDMPRVADMIAGAANASAISVDEYAMSLSQVGAVAQLTGLSFEDTSVAIAEMGNAGIKGSDAGTSLKTMLMNLIPTTKAQVQEFERLGLMAFDSAKAMEALEANGIQPVGEGLHETRQAVSDYLEATEGIPDDTKEMSDAVDKWLQRNGAMNNAFFDTEGNIESLANIQETLKESTKDMSKEQQLASLELLFGADAIRGAAVLADNGAEGYNKLADAMGKVTAQDVANIRLGNLKGDIEELSGAWETLLIKAGQVVIPVARSIVKALTWVVNVFNSLDDRATEFFVSVGLGSTIISGLVGALIKVAFVAAPLIPIFLQLLFVRNLVSVFMAFWSVLSSGGGFLAAAAAGFSRVYIILNSLVTLGGRLMFLSKVFRILWTTMLGPVGAVIGIVLGLVMAGQALYNTWEPFRNLVDSIAAALVNGWGVALEFARSAWESFISGFSGAGGELSGVMGFFQQVGEGARMLWEHLQTVGAGIMANLMPALQQLGASLMATIVPILQNLGNIIMTQVWPALQNLGSVIMTQVWPAIQQIGAALLPLIPVFMQIVGIVMGGLYIAFTTIASFILGTLLPVLINFAGPILGFLISMLGQLVTFLAGLLVPAINVLGAIFSFVFPLIVATVMAAINNVMGILQGLVTFFTGIINVVAGIFTGDWGRVWEGVKQIVSGAVQAIWNFVQLWIVGKVVAIARGALSVLSRLFSSSFSAIGSVVGSVMRTIGSVFSSIFGAIRSTASAGIGFVRSTISSGLSVIRSTWTSAWNALSGIVSGAIGGIRSAVNSVISAIKAPFAAAGSFLSGVGGKIIDGLIGGIRAGFDKVKSTLGSLTDMLPDWKGPADRDKVLLKPAGQLIMNSLVDGLDSEIDSVYRLLNGMNTDIPMSLDTILNPPKFSMFDAAVMAGKAPIDPAQRTEDPNANRTELNPRFDVTVRIGDQDITDIVDVRIEEHLDDAAELIGTGVA